MMELGDAKRMAITLVFCSTFFLALTACGLLHVHGWRGLAVSAVSGVAAVVLGRPYWMRLFERHPHARNERKAGNRAARRARDNRR